ncbi:MAG TPA: DNA helicase RecQ [Opitutales bacterium]|nr:DNA helicase RecQ [Opitutales bacterium]
MASDSNHLRPLLKRWFGFESFRPLQEEIIRDTLSDKDVFAVLPTGGGKSLCFQLPALARAGLTVVVSPLIALMKDQVDALETAGIPATFLNSSLPPDESRTRQRRLHQGEYRLLYVAPERLMLSGFLESLRGWSVNLFAIDEAHCISEWGHDFRPEYRKLQELRRLFPSVPFLALTATATERVRDDIVRQLHLRQPALYVASFNRPNLRYRVVAKSGSYAQTLRFVRERRGESGIIYCHSRKSTESVARRLAADGIKAAFYHAGLEAKERSRSQSDFLRDKIQVICATVAFGMGINKSNVRYVIHYDLPKNIEGYYQETGRAGRDGLPSECLLLYSPGDRIKQLRFIDEMPDEVEHANARAQLEQMVAYAEAGSCRRKFLLGYFGEQFPADNCGACDNCLAPARKFVPGPLREDWNATLAAQKFLSCIYRVREKSGFGVGLSHLADVLCGSQSAKVLKWSHQELSTYGIGHELKREEWTAVGRELVQLGYVRQNTDQYPVAELTAQGRRALSTREPIELADPRGQSRSRRELSSVGNVAGTGEIAHDEFLFEKLRQLRRRLADERDVPAYIIFSDASLREMAARCPRDEAAFSTIAGVGEKKLREFGALFIAEISAHAPSAGGETDINSIYL